MGLGGTATAIEGDTSAGKPRPARWNNAAGRGGEGGGRGGYLGVSKVVGERREFVQLQMLHRLVAANAGEGAASFRAIIRVLQQVKYTV